MFLTTAPLPVDFPVPATPASAGALSSARALFVPHDALPVADVRDRPDRWATLSVVAGAVRAGVPVFAWGSGAALLGRALGAPVHPAGPLGRWWADDGAPPPRAPLAAEISAVPRGATLLAGWGDVPARWRHGAALAVVSQAPPPALLRAFLGELPEATTRAPSLLQQVGGEAGLAALVADFYARCRADEVLGPVFAAHVQDWAAHEARVTAFWVTMLGGPPAWRGNLNGVHAGLGVRGEHVARWLAHFEAACAAHLPAAAAQALSGRARAMAARLRGNGAHERRVP
ncbi:group III truncated hemoglobin [Deinococcus maricopensis]|uniref:Globin n=1 Tax=Deinococcus maricopensis (strain DSM 21211 / LMG 22137 / NRRL B-23946 / LB-34) TaxID=709986 RepID=E8U814_DEIML|nr:group III truncated hemoglobin [Deinococcus maricopensis]ADV67203.1 globin [Deinococcus maricopensis DSM 21211]